MPFIETIAVYCQEYMQYNNIHGEHAFKIKFGGASNTHTHSLTELTSIRIISNEYIQYFSVLFCQNICR
jgi:hypothetical protein